MAKTITQLPDASVVNGSDELIIQQSGVTKRATKTELLAGIVNANIDAAAAIAFSKLAALDDANILVGNGSNVATKVAVTGDVTISNAGVTAIGSNKVLTAMVNDAAITTAKVADANITPSKLSQPFTLETSKASTSGTSIDFTGIPSWAKRITVMFDGVSTNGTSRVQVQLGDAGGIEATGYFSSITQITEGAAVAGSGGFATGFPIGYVTAGSNRTGVLCISLMSGNKWVAHGVLTDTSTSSTCQLAGLKGLSDTLTQIRITTVNGSDTFDAGDINISYEG